MISYAQKLQSLHRNPAHAPVVAPGPRDRVLSLLATTLGTPVEGLSSTTPFAELGLNSLLAVRFLDTVNRSFNLKLGVEVLFAHGTVARLIDHVGALIPDPNPTLTAAPTPAIVDDIAIIGMAGRFPGAPDLDRFWQALADGRCLIREVPADRWAAGGFYDRDPAAVGKTISKWAGFLDDIDRFDTGFFNISPREAAAMDPQHRLYLEQAWLAFENAGYTPARLAGSATGVYVGGSGSGYETMLLPDAKASQSYALTGNLVSLLASRIAYFLDLRGPAMVIDTACSASLVALDLACQALRRGEIRMALVGGVSLFLDEKPFIAMTRTGMLSPDGRCHTFDASANGIAVGEAAAALVLKPLAQALADGDRIDAVIKASGTNQDGRSNGITAPNPDAQEALLRSVYARAGIDPATITYIEAHGTGTPLGDPIEIAALRSALGTRSIDAEPCGIGAVKSNIGHTAEVAGLAGVIKTVLCLRHGELVPSVNFTSLNPKIDFGASGLNVVTNRRPWVASRGMPRRAGVSAFGLSGTNAHVVLEAPPDLPAPPAHLGPVPLLLSARDADALARRTRDLAEWLNGPGAGSNLMDVAATLAKGRAHFDHRVAVVATTIADAAHQFARRSYRTSVVKRNDPMPIPIGSGADAAADAYLRGVTPDWPGSEPAARANLPLPGYPFTRTVHWAARRPDVTEAPHPFSNGNDVGYVSHRFTADDPVVRDHVIGGVALLHASVFLEMARLAGTRKAGSDATGLRDVVWDQTVSVPEGGLTVRIDTTASANGVVCSLFAEATEKPAARCSVVFTPPTAMTSIDIHAIKASSHRHATRRELDLLDRGPVRLGPSFAGFDELWLTPDAALAWIGPIPADGGCVLPPRLMDAAIQAAAALLARDDGANLRLRYPSTVSAIDITGPAPRSGCYVVARQTGTDRVDITLADAHGVPRIHWTGFEMRAAAPRGAAIDMPPARTLRPVWVAREQVPGVVVEPDAIFGDSGLVERLTASRSVARAALDRPHDIARVAAGLRAGARIVWIEDGSGTTDGLLRLTKQLAASGLAESFIELRIVTTNVHRVTGHEPPLFPFGATVQGLAKAIGREFPAWRVIVLDVDGSAADPRATLLGAEPTANGEPAAWRNGIRYERVLEAIDGSADRTPLRRHGTYLLIGGMGRVGREIARHLASAYAANLILLGRSASNPDRLEFLADLRGLGSDAEYRQIDITEPNVLASVITSVKARFGALHGVIHAVVDPLFARLERTEEAAFAAALRPKTTGLTELAAATATEALDFLAVFSSIGAYAEFPGNIGQASYCAACCFEDAFAAQLHASGQPVRLIQWGLWDNDAFAGDGIRRLQRQGTYPMRASDAVAAFERILAGADSHVVHASLSESVWQSMGAVAPPDQRFVDISAALNEYGRNAEAADISLHHAVDAYGRALADQVMRQHGWTPDATGRDVWHARWKVLPRYDRLLDGLLDMLHRAPATAPTRAELLSRAPSLREPLELLELCTAALPDVINGERQGTDVLFPGGSMQRVEAIYRNQPVLAACNAMLASAVEAAAPFRILEVGAGTGATADAVLAALPADSVFEYHFTDVSAGFVRHARQRRSDARLRFAVLDIEKDPTGQGFDNAGFDLVVATNVLHATRDINETLRHIGTLLKPGGMLLINEMTVAEDFATLTFGLLDGWWRARDPNARLPHSPLLDVQGWRRELGKAGFAHVTAAPAPGFTNVATCPQVVLLAAKPALRRNVPSLQLKVEAPVLATAPAPIGTEGVETLVRGLVAAGLDLSPDAIDPETPFGDLGVDSIVAPQIAEDINRAAGISLRSTDLYNFATVRALATHITSRFPELATRAVPPPADPVGKRPPPSTISPPFDDYAAATKGNIAARTDGTDRAIAIIGMAGRFPDAPDVDAFWRNIATGRSAVREVDRFDLTPYFSPERGQAGKTYAKWAALLDDHDRFDPLFFAISPAEAEAMDPQQRLLLEEAWHALEDAGATPQSLDATRCGVFVGASANSYQAPASPSLQTLGGSMAILSARLSYFLNLKGPTFPIDTGCSSSLVALHLACQSLRLGETDMAVAAGVSCNLLSPPIFFYLSDAGMASADGRCKTFDDTADGFVPGEGVGVVVLKRLADAVRDGDRIHAVVLGTGINQDGKTSGLTAPSATSQTELERAVYQQAGISPATIGLIEAHGTGTRLGDPIEVAALTDAFAGYTSEKGFCAIGSVKTNIGHAMAAAGIAGLLKAVQALRHRTLPASLNFSTANRHIDFVNSPFTVNTETRPWTSASKLRAAVSSFGFSGTNAHVVLEQAPPAPPAASRPGPFLFVLSARTASGLQRRMRDLRDWLRGEPNEQPADIAYTLAVRRAHFRYRCAFIASSLGDLASRLAGTELPSSVPPGLGDLADRYVTGATVDFSIMQGRLISLPGYPFERERFWNPQTATPAVRPGLAEQVTGWLTRDHVIQGRRLLPGAAFLELARSTTQGNDPTWSMQDILWSAPVDATDGAAGLVVATERVPEGSRYSLRTDSGTHAAGLLVSHRETRPDPLDLQAIAARCTKVVEGSTVYGIANEHGFHYGPGYRVINRVRVGPNEALAHLALATAAREGWVLHPALLDGAFQAAACIGLARDDRSTLSYVPFALAEFHAFAPLDGACQVHARLTDSNAALMTFDITICADDGSVLASFRSLQARVLTSSETMLFEPVWVPAPETPPKAASGSVLALASDPIVSALRALLPDRQIIQVRATDAFTHVSPDCFEINPADPSDYRRLLAESGIGTNGTMAQLWALDAASPLPGATLATTIESMDPDTGLRALFLATQAALQSPEAGITRIVHVSAPSPNFSAAASFARTVNLESSLVTCRAVGVTVGEGSDWVTELDVSDKAAEVSYRNGIRSVRGLQPWLPSRSLPMPVGAVLVITGGAGAIGLAIARHLARTLHPRIALLGRTSLNPAQTQTLAEIEDDGAEIFYLCADVTSATALKAALDKVRRRFGPINGVIHAAGILQDARITGQAPEEFDAVMAPKLAGAMGLDHLTRNDPLAVFAVFSSTAASFGSAGQAAYAAANGFLDGFADWRGEQNRPGRTVAISWPLWEAGGMRPPPEVVAELNRRMGMTPMPNLAALAAFDSAISGSASRVVVLHGRREALAGFVAGSISPTVEGAIGLPSLPTDGQLRDRVEAYLRSLLSGVTKLSSDRIEPEERFESYGIDSMMIVRLNQQLEQDFGDLPKTLFFEYQTVRDLADCLISSHQGAVARRFETKPAVSTAAGDPESTQVAVARPIPAPTDDAIAIIGISGIYPMAANLDLFWRNLASGRDCIVEIPPDRWALDGFYDPDRNRPETSYSKWGGFIDGVDKFDARFFNISPREADALDPQTRKFLEVAWATMEDAGLTRDTLFRGDTDPTQRLAGVFVGVMYGDYQLFGPEEGARGNLIAPNAAYWNVANRVSHFLDLHGPSMAIDTACSSSLSAIHMACAALRNGDCSVAFAGGVNVTVHPGKHWILSKSGFASSDGRCRSFGEGGDGYVPGEGVGAVLLKPLSRAIVDGDRIHAVIRSSALNHGGRTNGYTVPNPIAQGNLIAAAMKRGNVGPETISYVEAHGTGTSLGDPVEIAGLARAFAGVTPASCAIGSVKSNIGHLESAAGIAAVTKVVLQLRHDTLAPSLHAERLNPNLDLSSTPFFVQHAASPWPRLPGRPRRAGISSFGAGGANAHLVIEDAPPPQAEADPPSGALIVPLSAATRDALTEQAMRLADWLEEDHAFDDFASVVRTLQVGREPMRYRYAVRAVTSADLIGQLRQFVEGGAAPTAVLPDWVNGGKIDWETQAPGPRRPVSLPTYPFAQRRCWVTLTPRTPIEIRGPEMISCATDDPLVADHRLGGETILAGAFLLESARHAGARTLNTTITGIADIRFMRPVSASMAPVVAVGPDGAFAVRVGETEHVTGLVLTDPRTPSPEPLDLAAIEARCTTRIEHGSVYTALATGGAQYGPAYRLIETVWRGSGEAMAELAPDLAGEGWPPNILDAAFQLTFALTEDGGGLAPFTIDRISVSGPLTSATHVVGSRREVGPGFVRLDLWLTDADGTILVAVDGFVARSSPATLPLRLLRPTWSQAATNPATPTGRVVIVAPAVDHRLGRSLCDAWPNGGATLVTRLPDTIDAGHVWYLAGADEAGSEITAVTTFVELVKRLAAQPKAISLTVVTHRANTVLAGEVPIATAAALCAFAKSVAREHPEFRMRIIDADAGVTSEELLRVPNVEGEIALRADQTWTKGLTETTLPAAPTTPWRRNGTYLIVGGAGGIGLALADHLIQRAGARIGILGRRAMDTALRERLDALGGEVLYLQADVTDIDAVKSAVGIVNARFGEICGAFHLALAMHDARAITLTPEQMAAVMAPKTLGVRNLISALRDSSLDAMMLFSSSNAHTANPGQSAYAAASAAEDAIGLQPAPWPVKIIDWGFWGDVGRVATPEYRASLARIGVHPISTREGLDVIERMLHAPLSQIVPLRITDSVARALGVRQAGMIGFVADAVESRAAGAAPMLVAASQSFAAMDSYAARLLLLALQDMGALRREGETIGADFAARYGIHPRFARLQAALLDILVRAGYLTEDGLVTSLAVSPAGGRKVALEQQRAQWIAAQPEVTPYLALLDICHARLREVLRGEVDANDVLFPGGKADLVEPIYRGNQVIDHFQAMVADAAVAVVRQRLQTLPAEAKLRVLEIGAGTGGTSAFAIAELAPFASRISYQFTDVGPAFLDAARQRFGQHSFVSFEHLDIEKSPASQGFETNSFDIVIAANVLHATRDLDTTLAHVRSLCREGGVLLVNEATARQDFNTMTFGLTRGWWLFADTERRIPHAPLLDAAGWLNALAEHGFNETRILTGGAGALQTVIAAAGDGGAASVTRPEAKPVAAPTAGGRKLEVLLRETVARSLRLSPEEVEPETSFAEYGADSIISVDLVREINLSLGIELKTTALFNYSTVRTLASYIETEYRDKFAAAEAEAEAPKPVSRVRERSERLREIIRKRRDSVTFATAPDTPPPDIAPIAAERPGQDDDSNLLELLRRLQAGKIDVNQALAETGDD